MLIQEERIQKKFRLTQIFCKVGIGPKDFDDGVEHAETHGYLGLDLI